MFICSLVYFINLIILMYLELYFFVFLFSHSIVKVKILHVFSITSPRFFLRIFNNFLPDSTVISSLLFFCFFFYTSFLFNILIFFYFGTYTDLNLDRWSKLYLDSNSSFILISQFNNYFLLLYPFELFSSLYW